MDYQLPPLSTETGVEHSTRNYSSNLEPEIIHRTYQNCPISCKSRPRWYISSKLLSLVLHIFILRIHDSVRCEGRQLNGDVK